MKGELPIEADLVPVELRRQRLAELGRPSSYTPEVGQYIASCYATQPFSIKTLCDREPTFPNYVTVLRWRKKYPEFEKMWTRAKEIRADVLMDDAFDIAEDVDPDSPFGSARVAHAKLRIGVRKDHARVLNPEVYGTTIHKLDGRIGVSFTDLVRKVEADVG